MSYRRKGQKQYGEWRIQVRWRDRKGRVHTRDFKDTDKGRKGLRRQLLKLRREGTKGIEVYAPSVQDLDDEPFF